MAVVAVGGVACGSEDEAATTESVAAATEAATTAETTESATTESTMTETTATDGGTTAAEGEELTLTGEDTTLVLDATTATVLTGLGVEVSPIAPATAANDGIAFPITGGTVASDTLAGTIEHSGGLRFSAGGTTVDVTDFVVDTTAGTLTATVGEGQVPLLALDLSGLERSMEGDVIVASGIDATLAGEAATALNEAFGVEAFTEGLAIGTVTVRATA
jgi:hypothetical protein